MEFSIEEKKAIVVLVCQISSTDCMVSSEEISFLDKISNALSISENEREEAVWMTTKEAQEVAKTMSIEKRQFLFDTLSEQVKVDGAIDNEEQKRIGYLCDFIGL